MQIDQKIRIRKIVQIFFLLLFILTVLQATYPFQPLLPPELFLWMDPLAAIGTQLAARFFDALFLLSLIVLLSPLVFGRAFCGWICPLGTVIDSGDYFTKKKRAKATRRLRPIKSILLALFIFLAILGIQYAWFMDPLPLLWRSSGVIGMAFFFLFSNTILNGLYTLGIFPNAVIDIQDRITAYLFPVATPQFTTLLFPLALILIILGLGLISRRFWCRNLCPLGALLGLLAKFSPFQRTVDDSCTSCQRCQRSCKMDAIEADYVTTEKAECILCLNCAQDCAPRSIHFRFQSPIRMKSAPDLTRRSLIGTGIAGLFGAGLFALRPRSERRSDRLIRPPGALEEDEFLERCIRCEECVRICSTAGGCLQMSFLENGLESLLTPVSKFRVGYCEYNCNLCGQICPTKAIQPLALEEKQEIKTGTAVLLKDRCIPYRLNEDCIVCEEHCPLPDKAIKLDRMLYTDQDTGEQRYVNYPYVDQDLCTGCGICENRCPLLGEAAIIVIREGEERM